MPFTKNDGGLGSAFVGSSVSRVSSIARTLYLLWAATNQLGYVFVACHHRLEGLSLLILSSLRLHSTIPFVYLLFLSLRNTSSPPPSTTLLHCPLQYPFVTVSYTHLDVYKRQIVDFPGRNPAWYSCIIFSVRGLSLWFKMYAKTL